MLCVLAMATRAQATFIPFHRCMHISSMTIFKATVQYNIIFLFSKYPKQILPDTDSQQSHIIQAMEKL